MDFDSIADELYAGAPADFTATRDALAREAKADGDRALAERIKKLRKPTAAADVVNRLPRSELEDLAELGRSLRKAHAELAGAELRELSRKRHDLIQGLLRRAGKLTDAVAREVEATFEAVVGSPQAAEQVLSGRLSSALSPDAAAPWPESTAMPTPKKPSPAPAPKPKQDKERAKREREERERVKRAELTRAVAAAEAELAKAEKRATKAAKASEDLRKKLRAAEEAEAAEQASVDTATQALADAEQALEDFGD